MSISKSSIRCATSFLAVFLPILAWAAHTDAPPGRYDYTAKVAAAGAAGKEAATKSNEPEEALALADRTYAYVVKALGEPALTDEKAELEADRKWLAAAKTERERKTVEKEIRRLRRRILFRHPDLQFKKLLAVQRGIPYSRENHMVDQYLGRWSRPGPGLIVLENWQTAPKKSSLLGDKLPTGTVINPDLHWNADRILFSFCDHTAKPPADAQKLKVPEVIVRDDPWVKKVDPTHPIYGPGYKAGGERAIAHRRYFIYECAADGSWVRQITGCPGDPMETQGGRQTAMIEDIDPCYLPDGGFVFSSTRGQNYGRCHWGRYVPSFLLYRADAGGKNIRQISFGEANEWEPAVMNDGRIAYTRWDYINRHAVWFQSLWATRPDGTAVSHVYGNYSEDIGVVTETKAIPGSRLLLCTASAHHNITSGSLFLLDPSVGEDGLQPVTRVTPEVPFPESEGWNTPGAYCSPFPVNDTLFLCSYSDETLGYPDYHPRHRREEYMAAWPSPSAFGIWLVDTLGGRELIYADPEISTFNPIPLVKRPMPPALVSTLPPPDKAPNTGLCYVENVYDCRSELPKNSIAAIRINKLDVMGACRRETLNQHDDLDLHKESLGTVPVAPDGSAQFRIPACVPIQLQAVDTNGVAVFTMRSFIYAQKGEVQGCTGCHENKFKSGAAKYAVQSPAGRTTYDPKPEVDLGYTGPFSFTKSVQPIFDKHCISCHGLGEGRRPAFSLVGTNGIYNLIQRKQISFVASYRETRESKPYDYFAAASPLWKKVKRGHGGVKLSKDELQTLALWMDLNVTEFTVGGGYSWNRPESREADPAGEARLRAAVKEALGDKVAAQPFDALVNRGMEERSRVLWLVKPEDRARFLLLVKASLKPKPAHDVQGTCGRDDACECNSCWIRRGGYNKPAIASCRRSKLETTRTGVRLMRDGKLLWNLEIDTPEGRPFFHPLNLPSGKPLTDIRPKDHIWHLGYWFSWKFINGINYWEPADAKRAGVEPEGRTRVTRKSISSDGLYCAVNLNLEYGPRAAKEPVLTEERTIEIAPPDSDGGYTITIRHVFTARHDVTLDRTPPHGSTAKGKWGGGYAGATLRLAPSAAAAFGVHGFAGGATPAAVTGTKTKFIDFTDPATGEGVTFTQVAAPPTARFYVWPDKRMINPSPVYTGPLSLKEGETLELAYRLTVHAADRRVH